MRISVLSIGSAACLIALLQGCTGLIDDPTLSNADGVGSGDGATQGATTTSSTSSSTTTTTSSGSYGSGSGGGEVGGSGGDIGGVGGSGGDTGGVGGSGGDTGGVGGDGVGGAGGGGVTAPGLPCDVEQLLGRCTGCHSGSFAPRGVRLTTYDEVSAQADRALREMRNGAMPPSGPLPDSDVRIFADWIAAGKPDTGCAP